DPDYSVQNILDPSAIIEPRFVYYQVVTKDRRSIAGVMKSETDSALTLQSGNGVTETVARADVKEVRAQSTSMMPEGFEASYGPQQLADVIAFIKSSRTRRQFPGNAPAVVAQAKDGTLTLPAEKAEIFGERAPFEPEFRNVGYWSGADDEVTWTVQVDKPGTFDVHLDYACSQSAAGD